MLRTFVIEPQATGYPLGLRRSDGSVFVEESVRGSPASASTTSGSSSGSSLRPPHSGRSSTSAGKPGSPPPEVSRPAPTRRQRSVNDRRLPWMLTVVLLLLVRSERHHGARRGWRRFAAGPA